MQKQYYAMEIIWLLSFFYRKEYMKQTISEGIKF